MCVKDNEYSRNLHLVWSVTSRTDNDELKVKDFSSDLILVLVLTFSLAVQQRNQCNAAICGISTYVHGSGGHEEGFLCPGRILCCRGPSNSMDGLSKVYKDIIGVCSAHAQVYLITHQK